MLKQKDNHNTQEQPKQTENKKKHPEPKNIHVVSTLGGHAKNNINLLKVLNFVDKAMQTLSNYSEELQTHLDVNLTHQDMS